MAGPMQLFKARIPTLPPKALDMLHLLNGREASIAMGRCQERREASTKDDPETLFAVDGCSLMHSTFKKHVSSRRNPLRVTSCYCYDCRFWGGPIAYQVFVEISILKFQHEAKNPVLTSLDMDRGVVLLVSGASATFHVPFILRSYSSHV